MTIRSERIDTAMRIHRLHLAPQSVPHAQPVVVRRARHRADWSAATTLLNEYVDWIDAMLGSVLGEKASAMRADRISAALTFAAPHHFFVAWRGDEPVGCVGVRIDDQGAELTRVYVRSGCRGLGVARLMVGVALDAARAAGYDSIRLDTHPTAMPAAHHVYQTLGFEQIGEAADISGGISMQLSLTRGVPMVA